MPGTARSPATVQAKSGRSPITARTFPGSRVEPVRSAGDSGCDRRLYRAASVGYLGNLFNSNFGLGVRIAALRPCRGSAGSE